jgi:hypothetical protein
MSLRLRAKCSKVSDSLRCSSTQGGIRQLDDPASSNAKSYITSGAGETREQQGRDWVKVKSSHCF